VAEQAILRSYGRKRCDFRRQPQFYFASQRGDGTLQVYVSGAPAKDWTLASKSPLRWWNFLIKADYRGIIQAPRNSETAPYPFTERP